MQYDPVKANEPLLAEIAECCAHTGMTKTAFGERVMNDKRFVFDLEAGRQITQKTLHRVRHGIMLASAIMGREAR